MKTFDDKVQFISTVVAIFIIATVVWYSFKRDCRPEERGQLRTNKWRNYRIEQCIDGNWQPVQVTLPAQPVQP